MWHSAPSARADRWHPSQMTYESNLSAAGLTTLPKPLRERLNVPLGGRLTWQLLPDGSLQVILKHAYVAPSRNPAQARQPADLGLHPPALRTLGD